ncbi:MAG: ABC transporter permease [Muribaculaceae bacterium]|nr:ABC transporter permease [Muribaculaceae bacterium]
MNYIKQILFELKYQKMVTWISISGTALAIFMVMSVYLTQSLYTFEMAPASKRNMILTGKGMHMQSINGNSMSASETMNHNLALNIYGKLDGIEKISLVNPGRGASDAGVKNGPSVSVETLGVDNEFWKLYDYKFISGKPFDKGDIETGNNFAILKESVAKALFHGTDVVGETIEIDNIPYTVRGVIEDSFILLPDGKVNIFTNYKHDGASSGEDEINGPTKVLMLMKPGVDPDYIKQQVSKKYEDANRELLKLDIELVYHQQPYTSEEIAIGGFGSNSDPEITERKKEFALIYALLLLLPAINLSNMTRSRLIHRVTEIGVRRAFGAKRVSIVSQIFSENLLMTFIGGCIGLSLSFLFLAFLSRYFIPINVPGNYLLEESSKVSSVVWHLFNFKVFFIAIGGCFILNVLSATLPSWRASLMQPATAISKSKQ